MEGKKKKRLSLKWKILRIALLYWALPFLVLISMIGMYMMGNEEKNQMKRLLAQMELNAKTCGERLADAVADSRQATYDRVLYEKYRMRESGEISDRAFFNAVQTYLDGQYAHKKNNSIAVLLLTDEETEDKYTSYNYSTGGSYRMLQEFYEEDGAFVLSYAKKLDTSVGFVCREGKLYIVRNMMDKNFHPWGVLVNRVYLDYCFEPFYKIQKEFLVKIILNEETVISTGEEAQWEKMPEITEEGKYIFEKERVFAWAGLQDNDFTLKLVLNTTKKELFTPLYGYIYVVCIMILCLVPMLILFLWLSRKYLSAPVESLMESAREIERGNLGYELLGDTGSLEFEYLRESFNKMSKRLKYQFDHIYEEELALRDAKIMALQSHINPHFMNNTLEIINWEARLSGNEKVSGMIEALSTLMDAAIDRRKLPEVPLSEEMIHVNAYLYITEQRLGKRLVVKKEIPEEVMGIAVPRLILQPIIENAIEHGIVPRGGGTITIRGRKEENYLYLEIVNDGEFSEEDEKRVKRLLAPDYDTSREPSGNLGIANVNQRLKILYGESCGLCVRRCGKEETISVLTILVKN